MSSNHVNFIIRNGKSLKKLLSGSNLHTCWNSTFGGKLLCVKIPTNVVSQDGHDSINNDRDKLLFSLV